MRFLCSSLNVEIYVRSHSLYIRREIPVKRRRRSLRSSTLTGQPPIYHPGIVPTETEKLPRPVLDKYKRRKSEDTFMSMVLRRYM